MVATSWAKDLDICLKGPIRFQTICCQPKSKFAFDYNKKTKDIQWINLTFRLYF